MQRMLIISSLCSIFIFITATMLCLCWRKKTEKNDLLGLDGLVTQMNPDENVNHLPGTIASFDPDDAAANATCDAVNDAKSRSTTLNNSRRSLPDIPLDGLHSVTEIVNYERNGDNSSDLYATVEPYNAGKRHTLPNGLDSRPSISQHSSISQADDSLSPYARVKDHPYAKLKKTEHPYAYVQPGSSRSHEENIEASASSNGLRGERVSTSQTLSEPVVPSRSPRSSEQIGIDIPAASAVAGGVAASQELPYMTPPIAQPNFSGDSQDSSKGYTSISVREPLANIRAQTKGLNKGQAADLDPHYSTVSDDSDDVYTTIQDPNNVIYTSESETYAQIQPPTLSMAVEENSNSTEAPQRERPMDVTERLCQFDSALRLPIAESLKNDVNTHSRQASSSSSTVNVGSPKPEKRQANSPLPPPPPLPSGLDAANEKLAAFKTLDDMYAKVQKSKKRNDKDEDSCPNVIEVKETQTLTQASTSELKDEEKQKYDTGDSLTNTGSDLYTEHNYETLRKSSNPRYDKLKPKDTEPTLEPGYDVINGPASILSLDPGYEALKHGNEASSDEDPNYEELRHRASSFSDSAGYSTIGNKVTIGSNIEMDGYSVVQKQSQSSLSEEVKSKSSSNYESDFRDLSTDEPNYESMPNEIYATLNSADTESDPNYESVCSSDPNYESVKFLDESVDEPPYERLQDDDSSKTDSRQSSSDKIQSLGCVCENNLKHCTDAQCLNHCRKTDSEHPNRKGNPDSNSNVSVQFESDFDGIVQV